MEEKTFTHIQMTDDENIAIYYRSSNIDREGLALSQAIEFAEKNI